MSTYFVTNIYLDMEETQQIIALGQPPRRGRPRRGEPKTAAERAKAYRARKKASNQAMAGEGRDIESSRALGWPRLNLPYGLGSNYALPYVVCRGAIFSAMVWRGQSRPICTTPVQVAEWGRMRIHQVAGERLDQGDADVYCGLVALAYDEPTAGIAVSVAFKADGFLKSLGRSRGGASRRWLAASLERLKAATFEFDSPELGVVAMSLVSTVTSERAAAHVVELNTAIDSISNGWALIPGDTRRMLHAPLVKSLHAFYSTHKVPMPISVAKLKRLSGHGATRDQRFMPALVEALASLQKVTGWHRCELDAQGHLVVVEKAEKQKKSVPSNPASPPKESKTIPARSYPWNLHTTAEELTKHGRDGFILSEDFDAIDIEYRLTSYEYKEARRRIAAAVPSPDAQGKMGILFDYLLTVRVPSDDPNDI